MLPRQIMKQVVLFSYSHSNDGTNSTTQDITVAINDLNDEAPVFTSNSSFTADENQTAIGTVTATDADANTTLAYSLGGTDAASMAINSATGVLVLPQRQTTKQSHHIV